MAQGMRVETGWRNSAGFMTASAGIARRPPHHPTAVENLRRAGYGIDKLVLEAMARAGTCRTASVCIRRPGPLGASSASPTVCGPSKEASDATYLHWKCGVIRNGNGAGLVRFDVVL